ncbi:DNA replication factor Cdt1 isoform X1 [Schistocerca americana]|uniref:DNA replication factor Cdt1 isoform X1 n=1 Tax=Schistocerca americana TaxID=7009 RepID=UPI001F501021|nr:DNA replication factor Cdt1 isoform X1 [Schistocerca americana]
MSQSSITNYFIKRKRHTADDVKTQSKVLIIDKRNENLQNDSCKTILRGDAKADGENSNRKIILKCSSDSQNPVQKSTLSEQKNKSNIRRCGKKTLPEKRVSFNCDIRESFQNANKKFPIVEKSETQETLLESKPSENGSSQLNQGISPEAGELVVLQLSPCEKKSKAIQSMEPLESCQDKVQVGKPLDITNARQELGLMTPKRLQENSCLPKELSLAEIRNKLSRSTRLAELKEKVTKINRCATKLKELETRRKALETPGTPKIQKFKALDIEVPVSPQSSVSSTPQKLLSPLKSPLKSPAHQRYAALARSEVPSLPLPYSYRCLAEAFRCLDTVVSMMHNRKEAVTFNKVSPAVREMLRKEFTEFHLGQIKHVYPEAYTYTQQKCHVFGCAVKQEKYELTLEPVLLKMQEVGADNSKVEPTMTPSYLLERRKVFHSKLLEIVKDQHEAFLKSLDPPLILEKSKLTRWHPEFDIDKLPDLPTESLPKPPNEISYRTAKDVLECAKDIFQCNKRMENALKLVSEKQSQSRTEARVNERVEAFKTDLYKGIPKSVLEKVRAKQAAKTLKEMTIKPEEEKEIVRYTRLPEIARILRTLFVAERRRVLPVELVLDKLRDSTRENLSSSELQVHIELLIKSVPGWVEFELVRTSKYLRLSKNGDMSKVMKRLETLAETKSSL